MKRLISSILLALVALCSAMVAQAQSQMVITKTDGTQITIRVADIQDVTFPSDDHIDLQLSYSSFWLKPSQCVMLDAFSRTIEGVEEKLDEVSWRTTDASVATVDADGTVTGVGDGTCQIIASALGSQAALTIHVSSQTMLDIDIQRVTNRSCTYSITPADPSLRYYSLLRIQSGEYSVDGMVQHGSEEQNAYHFALDWWAFCAELYGMTWLDFMNQSGLTTGRTSATEEDLKTGSQYCIFAFALNEDGTLASPVEVRKFTTGEPEQSDITFEVSIDEVNTTEAIFTITPSCDDPYFVSVQRASYVDWFVTNDCVDTEMVQSLVSSFKPERYPEAYCHGTVTRSTSDFLASIRKNEDYYVIVFGFDDGLTSYVSLTKFHTPAR